MTRTLMTVLLLWSASAVPAAPAAEILLESARLRLVLGTDASWQSVFDKRTGIERLAPASRMPFAVATIDRKSLGAQSVVLEGDRLRVILDGGQTELLFRVKSPDDWIAFQLERVSGPRPSQLTLLRLPVKPLDHFGPRLNGVWDLQGGIVLSAINLQTQAASARRGDHVELAVTTQDGPGPGLEGAGAALIVGPPAELRACLRHLAAAYDLPRNEGPAGPAKDLPEARESYWFLGFGEKDADKVIEYCEQSGIRQVLMMSGSWCKDVGHYTFRTDLYPDGIESLRRTAAARSAARTWWTPKVSGSRPRRGPGVWPRP
jgi:hypothetical protein